MATATTETFDFAYALTGNFNDLKILDENKKTSNYVDAAAGDVTLQDPKGGTLSEGHTAKITHVGFSAYSFDKGKYTFVGTADVTDHSKTLSGLVVEDSSGKLFFLTNTEYSGKLDGNNGSLTITDGQTSLCFMAGTLISTPDGEVAVETLKRGDHVLTQDGRIATIDWLGIQTISTRFADKLRVLPIRIRAGAIAENVPSRDLLVSPDHAILVEGALIQAGALVNGTSIAREPNVPMTFSYYHVEVEDHSLILAENIPAETFVDNVERLAFDNWAEHEALYPNGKPITELPFPRAKSQRQVPVSTRVMLSARAEAMGLASAAVA
jgi:hypothetical protein